MVKIISVRQPWAWLIVAGHKDIENRTWRTSYRGRLLIHASLATEPEDFPMQRQWIETWRVPVRGLKGRLAFTWPMPWNLRSLSRGVGNWAYGKLVMP